MLSDAEMTNGMHCPDRALALRLAAVLLALCLAFLSRPAAAAACNSVSGGNWNVIARWSCGRVPLASDDVTISNGHTVTVNIAGAVANTLTITGGGSNTSLAFNAGTSLTITGNATVNRPTTASRTSAINAGAGTLTVGGSMTLAGTTGTRYTGLTISTGTVTITGNLTPSGSSSRVTFSGAGTLNIGGNFTSSPSAATYTASTGTVVYNGSGAQSVGAYNYYNLTINKSAGTATTQGNITIGNNLTLTTGTLNIAANSIDRGAAGGTFTLGSGSLLQIAAANLPANYSTVSIATDSTVEYNPGFNMTVPAPGGGANYGNLLLSNSGNRIFNSAMIIAGNLTATGTVAAVMNAGITVNGNVDLGATTSFDPKAYTHTFKGNYTNNGSTVSDATNTSTIVMDGTSAQAIGGAGLWFYRLTINNAAGVTANASFSVARNFTNTAGFNAGTTTTTFNGTAAQSITGTTTFYNLTVNNTAGGTGVTINNDVTASNALTFTSGLVTTGTNTLIFSSTSSCAVTRTSGYVNGKLRKSFTATQLTCDFEIGDATNYTPVNVAFSSVSSAGTVTAKATSGDHPQISTSSLDSANSINRYWMLTPGGGLAFGGVTLTFTPISGSPVDHDNTANVGSYITQRYEISGGACDPADAGYTGAGSWNNTTATGVQTTTSIAATGVSTFGSICSHFAHAKGTISSFMREPQWIYQRELYY